MKIKYSWLTKRKQLANIDVWKLKRAGKNVRKNSSKKKTKFETYLIGAINKRRNRDHLEIFIAALSFNLRKNTAQ